MAHSCPLPSASDLNPTGHTASVARSWAATVDEQEDQAEDVDEDEDAEALSVARKYGTARRQLLSPKSRRDIAPNQ